MIDRPVWRIRDGKATLVVYEIWRGPNGETGHRRCARRSEFGIEIHVTVAFLVSMVGLSMDKVCAQLRFFWQLELSKSQADALLNQLAQQWADEFESLCQLLAVSAVVHADETSWSLNSVWAFLSEKARVLVFGCRKDGDTLAQILSKDDFDGILVSDDAAVYHGFSQGTEVLGSSASQSHSIHSAGAGQHGVQNLSGWSAGRVRKAKRVAADRSV